jgi:hypothetical protein
MSMLLAVSAAASLYAETPSSIPQYGKASDKPRVGLAPLVAPQKKFAPAELAAFIDAAIERRLAAQKVTTAPRTDDAEYLRRVSLDVVGVIPTAERTAAFLADERSDKRSALIDELLAAPEYARHMTDEWRELLIPTTAASLRREHQYGIEWLHAAFRQNKPWSDVVTGILTAEGFQAENGAVTILMTHQSLDEITDRAAKVFLGVQLQCAQCHNHPFSDWRQDEYWELAAFFKNVKPQYKKENKIEMYGVSERGDRKPIMTPASLKVVPAAYLRSGPADVSDAEPALPVFAAWLTAPENPWLARAFVNRLWRQFFGRGLVEPIDDLRADNPATHPEVLDELARQFVAHNFDVHYLIRAITATTAYQRTSRIGTEPDAAETVKLYGRMPLKVVQPYPLRDSVERVLSLGDAPAAEPAKLPDDPYQAIRELRKRRGSRDSFASYFQGEDGASPTSYQAGLPQALRLMNGKDAQYRPSKASDEVRRRYAKPEEGVEFVYLAALSRRPTPDELKAAVAYVQTKGERKYTDLIWALLNSTEFAANH